MVNSLVIMMGSLIVSPIIGYLIYYLTANALGIRTILLGGIYGLSILVVLAILSNIITTSSNLNWVLVGILYFAICCLLWGFYFNTPKGGMKTFSLIGMVLVYGVGYLLGTLGFVILWYIMSDFTLYQEEDLGHGLVYQERSITGALSGNQGTVVEIRKTVPGLPFLLYKTAGKKYLNEGVYQKSIDVVYEADRKVVVMKSRNDEWGDEIVIE